MEGSWATLQLHYSEEETPADVLTASVKLSLPGVEVFIPSLRFKDKRGEYVYSLFDGYMFVRGEGFVDRDYISLSKNSHVYQVLVSSPGSKHVAYTPHSKIEQMRAQLEALIPNDFEVDSMVFVHRGVFSGLKGKVISVEEDKVVVEVYMPLGSLTKLTRVPKMFIRQMTEDDE